jgi:membrane-associated protein
MESFLEMLAGGPPALLYVLVAGGAAVENVAPVVPSDMFVLLGAFLASAGRANPWGVLAGTWAANVAGSLLIYRLAHVYGRTFFATRIGAHLLKPHQIRQIGGFYARWGGAALFLGRFVPGVRAMVPVFAGVAHMPLRAVAPPLALASAIWYAVLVLLGSAAGRNWRVVAHLFDRLSAGLLAVGVLIALLVFLWWLRSRGATA